jgi:hypothetical protein
MAGRKERQPDALVLKEAPRRHGCHHWPGRGGHADHQRRGNGAQAGPLLDQVGGQIALFAGDSAYDQDGVYASVAQRQPAAAIIVSSRTL